MTTTTRRRPRQLRYPRYGLEREARRALVGSMSELALRWGRRFLVALLVGYLLFAHGCHGEDEDHELSVMFPLAREHQPNEPVSRGAVGDP